MIFVRNEPTRLKLEDEIKEHYSSKCSDWSQQAYKSHRLMSCGVVAVEEGHMIRCRPQAGRFTSRRKDSRRAMTQDGFYFT